MVQICQGLALVSSPHLVTCRPCTGPRALTFKVFPCVWEENGSGAAHRALCTAASPSANEEHIGSKWLSGAV